MMPLGMVEIGESGVIGKITGQDEVSKMGGNLICAVKDSRVALSQSMAMRVLVN